MHATQSSIHARRLSVRLVTRLSGLRCARITHRFPLCQIFLDLAYSLGTVDSILLVLLNTVYDHSIAKNNAKTKNTYT